MRLSQLPDELENENHNCICEEESNKNEEGANRRHLDQQHQINLRPHTGLNQVLTRDQPITEWIFPDGLHSIDDLLNENEEQIYDDIAERENVNRTEDGVVEAAVTIVVDPGDTNTAIEVEGEIVTNPDLFSICGIHLCEISSEKPNLKVQLMMVGILVFPILIVILVSYFLMSSDPIRDDFENNSVIRYSTPSFAPSSAPSFSSGAPSRSPSLHPRTKDITTFLLDVSGNETLILGTPQNKALDWIIHEDGQQLSYNHPNLVQRYALMVIYYALSGHSWRQNEGFGSNGDECDWFGVVCTSQLQMYAVTYLYLDANNLYGTLPNEIGLFPKMTTLELDNNGIEGRLPLSLFQLGRLKELRLEMCSLTGTIPSAIGSLTKLVGLFLYGNELSGTIPSTIGQLKMLENLQLGQNNLVGKMPESVCDLSLRTLQRDCSVFCKCCQSCWTGGSRL